MIVYVNQLSLIFAILFVMAGMTMAYTDQCTGPSLDGQHNNASSELLCAILCKASGDCSSFLFKEWDDFVKDDDPNCKSYEYVLFQGVDFCVCFSDWLQRQLHYPNKVRRQLHGRDTTTSAWIQVVCWHLESEKVQQLPFNHMSINESPFGPLILDSTTCLGPTSTPEPLLNLMGSTWNWRFLDLTPRGFYGDKIPRLAMREPSDGTDIHSVENKEKTCFCYYNRCASRGGHVIHEYNSNISDAINEMFKDSPIPVRHQGIRGQDTTKLLWTNMLAVHKSLVAQCPIFQDFVWGQATGHVVDTIANGLKPGTDSRGS